MHRHFWLLGYSTKLFKNLQVTQVITPLGNKYADEQPTTLVHKPVTINDGFGHAQVLLYVRIDGDRHRVHLLSA